MVFDASYGEFGLAFKVHYVAERVPIGISTQDETEIFNASILTKRLASAYEEEYRCIATDRSERSILCVEQQFMTFHPKQLLGLVFGARIPQADIKLVLSWTSARSTPIAILKCFVDDAGAIQIMPYTP